MCILGSALRTRAALVLVACLGFALTACADDAASAPPERNEPLPGLVPSPRALPGAGRWQLAHKIPTGRIYAIAWSPDGRKIAYSELSYIRICDATTLETERVLVGHSGRVTSISWNRANNRIASASYDGTIRIWSGLGAPETVLKGHTRETTTVEWTRDGKKLASGSKDGTVRIWTSQGALERSLAVSAPVSCVAWSPDGSRLLSGDDRNQIRIWQVQSGAMTPIEGQLGPVTTVAWQPDGKRFASATWGLVEGGKRVVDLRLWSLDGSLVDTAIGDQSIYSLQWSPDGRVLAVSYEDAVLQLHSAATVVKSKIQLPQLDGRTSEAPVAWSPDGTKIALGGTGVIAVVNAADVSKVQSFPTSPRATHRFVPIVAMDPSRKRVIAFVREGAADQQALLNLETGSLIQLPDELTRASLTDQSFSPDGGRLVGVVDQARLLVWNPEKGTTDVIVRSEQPIFDCVWSPRDDRIAYRDNQKLVRIVKSNGAQVAQLAPPKGGPAPGLRQGRQFGIEGATMDRRSLRAGRQRFTCRN